MTKMRIGRWTLITFWLLVLLATLARAQSDATANGSASTASLASGGSGGGGGGGTVTQGPSNGGSDPWSVTCASGCAGGTSDVDDGSVAAGQTTGINIGLTQVFDGAVTAYFAP